MVSRRTPRTAFEIYIHISDDSNTGSPVLEI